QQSQAQPSAKASQPQVIEGIVIRNNRRIPPDTIKYNIQTKKGDILDNNVIRADIRRLYALGYFDDITVYQEDGSTGKIIIFDVKEKRLIRSIAYKGIKSYTRSEIIDRLRERKVGLNEESPYEPARVGKATVVLKQMLAEKGHQDATIRTETENIPPD